MCSNVLTSSSSNGGFIGSDLQRGTTRHTYKERFHPGKVGGLPPFWFQQTDEGISSVTDHHRKIAHGHKGGAKTNIPKIMMEENFRPNTVGHIITNRMWEIVDADGNSMTSYVHAGFSKPAEYDKSGDKRPSNGFGVYYWDKVKGKEITNEYMVIIPANHSRFISPEGELYDGVGFNLRQEIGLDPGKRRRGQPRK